MTPLSNFVLSSCVLVHLVVVVHALTRTEFQTILEGRCEEYQKIFNKLALPKDCRTVSTSFLEIFDTTSAACRRESYENFVERVQHPIPKNKGLLWSGVKDLVEQISLLGKRYMPITYTLGGFMLDDIEICGDVMTGTAGCRSCEAKDAVRAFWDMTSEYYAKSLSGSVVILLSARKVDGKESIYYEGSILATTEVPNLSPKISSFEVWPIEALNVSKADQIKVKCEQPSVKNLRKSIEASKRPYKCIEDSTIPMLAMCLNEPKLCKKPSPINGQKSMEVELFPFLCILASSVAFYGVGIDNSD